MRGLLTFIIAAAATMLVFIQDGVAQEAEFYEVSFQSSDGTVQQKMIIRAGRPASMIVANGSDATRRSRFMVIAQTQGAGKAWAWILGFSGREDDWTLTHEGAADITSATAASIQSSSGGSTPIVAKFSKIEQKDIASRCAKFDTRLEANRLPASLSSATPRPDCCTARGPGGCTISCCGGCCSDEASCPGASCCP